MRKLMAVSVMAPAIVLGGASVAGASVTGGQDVGPAGGIFHPISRSLGYLVDGAYWAGPGGAGVWSGHGSHGSSVWGY